MCPRLRLYTALSPAEQAAGEFGGKPRPAAVPTFPTVPIFGLSFSKMSMDETVRFLTNAIRQKRRTHVITGNPIMVMAALDDPVFYKAMDEADLIVPDGAGVVWAARYVGEPVAERVAGFDLMHKLLETGALEGWAAYLLGTTDDAVREASRRLQERYPGVRIVGCRDGFFGPDEDEEVVAEIRRLAPDMLFVARGLNTQEPWIAKYKDALGVPVMMGVGGSLDIAAGRLKRAPVLWQRLGLEWLYRLIKQPSRFGRMLVLPKFALKVIREKENVTKRG